MAIQEHTEAADLELRRELAFDANIEVSKLAGAIKGLMIGDEDQRMLSGIMSRIQQCSEIVHHCMRLDGLEDDDAGRPELKSLKRQFDGMLA